MDTFSPYLEVVLRPVGVKGFILLPRRCPVERTYSWLHWCRRLNMDYERLPATSAILYLHSYDSAYATQTSPKHFLSLGVSKHPLR
ncbi:MAG: transposase [Hormoscilla sp. GM7CHS1pb]|nr:transposase [Hormoscilla sp. GM7CHS1pb]